MTRQDHKYVNLPRQLVGVVDTCVAGIFKNGTQVYANRKDFIIKAIQQQIDFEKSKEISKSLKLKQEGIIKVSSRTRRGGNRPKNV